MLKIVIFLNGQRGISVLNYLSELSEINISAVVTPPVFSNECLELLKEDRFIHIELENVNNPQAIGQLTRFNADVFVIAGYSTIFKREILSLPILGTLNLHAGTLPAYRGGSPLNWQIINGESKAGLSVILADDGIDTGDVVCEEKVSIGCKDTIADLHVRANEIFPELTHRALKKIASKELNRIQFEDDAVYWHQRCDLDGHIDFNNINAIDVDRMVRGLTHPYPGAYAYCNNQKVRIFSVEVPDFTLKGNNGRVCFIENKGPYVICSDKAILLIDYQFEDNADQSLVHGQYLIS